jgi:hypothetical protein
MSFATTKHAEPYVFLELELTLTTGLTLAAKLPHTGVGVEFSFLKGLKPCRYGHPDNWDDGAPDEIEILAAKLVDDTLFTSGTGFALMAGAGADLLPLLSAVDRSTLEDAMAARVARKN